MTVGGVIIMIGGRRNFGGLARNDGGRWNKDDEWRSIMKPERKTMKAMEQIEKKVRQCHAQGPLGRI